MTQEALRGHSQVMSAYFREIATTPLLTSAEELELASRIADGDVEARDHLVRANLRLVVSHARRFLQRGVDLEDLVAEGNLGLIRASETFNPDFGLRFSTYAGYWIKQSIRRYVLDRGKFVRVPAYVVTLLAKWKRASAALAGELGRVPSAEEVGLALGLPEKQVRIMREALHADYLMRHREESCGEEKGEQPELLFACDRVSSVEDVLEHEEERSAVLAGIDRLEDREATILRLRFGLGSAESLTLKAVGERLGLTIVRVRQLEQKALVKVAAGMDRSTP